VFPLRRSHRPLPSNGVEAKLATGKYWPQHARRTVRVVVHGKGLLYRSSVTGGPASLRLTSLGVGKGAW